MAKLKTLDLHLTNLDLIRVGNTYATTITMTDWDDGAQITFTANLPFPIVAVPNFKVRVQVEDLIPATAPQP